MKTSFKDQNTAGPVKGSLKTSEPWMVELLQKEVRPATGCTEPVAVALAAARAIELLAVPFSELHIGVSPNIYKNGFAVMLPGVQEAGLDLAAALGAARGNSTAGLSVLRHLTESEIELGRTWLSEGKILIELLDTEEKVLITAQARSEDGEHSVTVRFQGRHDRVVYEEKDGEIQLEIQETIGKAKGKSTENSAFYTMDIRTLIQEIEAMDTEPLAFLLDGIKMNMAMAEIGMVSPVGLGTAYALKRRYAMEGTAQDLSKLAMILTAGASDARMAGVDLPVMSSNGSGNNGITALMPLAAYFELNEVSRADQIRAIAISHLLNSYIKAEIGRLSALCSCAIAASTGAAAAMAWLDTRDLDVVEGTIINMVANLSGMICDGAKLGCALKLATAASTAAVTAGLAAEGVRVPAGNGLVGRTVEDTIRNLGILSRKGMQLADTVVLDIQSAYGDQPS
jgi:L-cysteine desulfidase